MAYHFIIFGFSSSDDQKCTWLKIMFSILLVLIYIFKIVFNNSSKDHRNCKLQESRILATVQITRATIYWSRNSLQLYWQQCEENQCKVELTTDVEGGDWIIS